MIARVFIGTIVGLLIGELVFGDWFFGNRMNKLNLIRGVTILNDVSHLYDTNGKPIIYKRDKFGFRGKYEGPASIDVLTIGGSATDQRYLTEEETWQDVLRKDFLYSGRTVSIVNAGVDGQSTYGHIKNFEWWFPTVPSLRAKFFYFT